ncbi:MAG: hypothetical protein ABIW38_01325 [Ferruginibacter sp.]
MTELNEIFELEFGNGTIQVEQIQIPGQAFFRVIFSNQVAELRLLRATNASQEKFWTSVPEGRQELAQQVGSLIEKYYRSKKK